MIDNLTQKDGYNTSITLPDYRAPPNDLPPPRISTISALDDENPPSRSTIPVRRLGGPPDSSKDATLNDLYKEHAEEALYGDEGFKALTYIKRLFTIDFIILAVQLALALFLHFISSNFWVSFLKFILVGMTIPEIIPIFLQGSVLASKGVSPSKTKKYFGIEIVRLMRFVTYSLAIFVWVLILITTIVSLFARPKIRGSLMVEIQIIGLYFVA